MSGRLDLGDYSTREAYQCQTGRYGWFLDRLLPAEMQIFRTAKHYCDTVEKLGHEVVLRDLYRMGFDPVLKAQEQAQSHFVRLPDVASELQIIGGADVFVLV